MHFWKSKMVFFGVALAGAVAFLADPPSAQASPIFNSTFTATAPTTTLGTIRHVRQDESDGTVYVLGNSTNGLGSLSADGATFTSISYSTPLPSHSSSDFAISQGRAFIVINGSSPGIYRYDITGSTATFVASSALVSGVAAVTFDGANTVYVSKGTTAYSLDTSLNSRSPTSTVSAIPSRLAYGGGSLFYLSTAGAFTRAALGGSDTTIVTGGPSSASVKGLVASSDGSALYYASTTGFGKRSATAGTLLWAISTAGLAGIDVSTSTGRITLINSSGTVTTYNPIPPVSGASSSASGTSAILSWDAGALDDDFSGVTIRRGTGGYPASASDGIAVTSSALGVSLTDTDLGEGTYYYSLFNQTMDGYYSAAATSTVTIDLPPDAPTLTAATTGATVALSWSVPADTDIFVLRRGTSDFPTAYTDGVAVTTTNSSVSSLTENAMPDGTYFYSLFAADSGRNYSTAGTASVTVDTTAPSAPSLGAVASGTSVFLSWDTPVTTDAFLLRRSTTGFPATISAGTGVTTTIATSFVNANLDDGTYYYSLFARDSVGNYSTAGTASASIDTTGPSAPTGFSATASGGGIALSWSNPVDIDFSSSTIRRSTSDFPASATDGAAVTSTTATSYSDLSLGDGTYYYSIFAADAMGNLSARATSTATVNTTVTPPAASGGGGVGSFFAPPTTLNAAPLPTSIPKSEFPLDARPPAQSAPAAGSPVTKTIPVITRTLRQGDRGTDVKALQALLNALGFTVAKNGPGSPGQETTFFGAATARAVKRFQETYKDAILRPYNLEKGTGLVGAKMREFIRSLR